VKFNAGTSLLQLLMHYTVVDIKCSLFGVFLIYWASQKMYAWWHAVMQWDGSVLFGGITCSYTPLLANVGENCYWWSKCIPLKNVTFQQNGALLHCYHNKRFL